MGKREKVISLFLVSILFLLLRLWDIGFDLSNSDALRWHRRSENFLSAVKQHDFASTYQHYQPGVTLMLVSAVVKQGFIYYIRFSGDTTFTLENYKVFPVIDGVSKFAVVFVLFLLFLLQLFLITKILDMRTALIFGFLIAVEPYLIGVDRWFHLTSMETYFGFSAFLALLVYLKEFKERWLVISSVLLALSILSKLTGLILLPLFFLIILASKRNIRHVLLYVAAFTLTFFVLFPALWANTPYVLNKFYSAMTNAVANDIRSVEISGIVTYVFYFLVMIYKLSPVVLVLLPFGIYLVLKERKIPFRMSLLTLVYIIWYLIALSLPEKKIDRYILVIIPPVILLVSNYLARVRIKYLVLCLIASLTFIAFVIYNDHPIYSGFYNPLFGGTKKALELGIYDNSGEYFAQAAFYLNTLGRNNTVYIPDNYDAFAAYYGGNKARTLQGNVNYVVRSIDIDRKILIDPVCQTLYKSFGPRNFPHVVGIFKCL